MTKAAPVSNSEEKKMVQLSRRSSLIGGLAMGAALLARRGLAQTPAPSTSPASGGGYPFSVPPLGYAFSANEPSIDAQTMELHHDKHHAAYVANLNAALKDYPQVAAMPLPQILGNLGQVPEAIRTAVRNNGGGHANHTMFWQLMGGKGGAPDGQLAQAIDRDFGSFDKLKDGFNKGGASVFGSGWVMVLVDRDGKLSLTTRPNQDSPLMDGKHVLMANDVWEHAYYLKYQNRRPEYLAAWWNVLDWQKIAARYQEATAGTLQL